MEETREGGVFLKRVKAREYGGDDDIEEHTGQSERTKSW